MIDVEEEEDDHIRMDVGFSIGTVVGLPTNIEARMVCSVSLHPLRAMTLGHVPAPPRYPNYHLIED